MHSVADRTPEDPSTRELLMKKLISVPAMGALFGWLLICAAARGEIALDLSSPEACYATWMRAFEAGDAVTLDGCSIGSGAERAWARAQAAQSHALHHLEQAMGERFGATWDQTISGRLALDKIRETLDDDLHADLKRAKLATPDNGRALLVANEGEPDEKQPRIVLSENRWKFDLASLSDYRGDEDATRLRAIARAARELSRSVRAGEFTSVAIAADAIVEKLTAAVETPLATRPTQAAQR